MIRNPIRAYVERVIARTVPRLISTGITANNREIERQLVAAGVLPKNWRDIVAARDAVADETESDVSG